MSDEPIDEELLRHYVDPYVEYITGKMQRELDDFFAREVPPKDDGK